jgi:hypothetical protein
LEAGSQVQTLCAPGQIFLLGPPHFGMTCHASGKFSPFIQKVLAFCKAMSRVRTDFGLSLMHFLFIWVFAFWYAMSRVRTKSWPLERLELGRYQSGQETDIFGRILSRHQSPKKAEKVSNIYRHYPGSCQHPINVLRRGPRHQFGVVYTVATNHEIITRFLCLRVCHVMKL